MVAADHEALVSSCRGMNPVHRLVATFPPAHRHSARVGLHQVFGCCGTQQHELHVAGRSAKHRARVPSTAPYQLCLPRGGTQMSGREQRPNLIPKDCEGWEAFTATCCLCPSREACDCFCVSLRGSCPVPCSRKVQRRVGICPLPMKSRRPLKLVVLLL